MADEIDLAQHHIEIEMELRLKHRPTARQVIPTGHCHYCGEEVDGGITGGKIYCDDACAEDHKWLLDRAKQNDRRL